MVCCCHLEKIEAHVLIFSTKMPRKLSEKILRLWKLRAILNRVIVPGIVFIPLFLLQFMRVRTVSGLTYYCRTGKSFKGQMMNRFLLTDCRAVLSGNYR